MKANTGLRARGVDKVRGLLGALSLYCGAAASGCISAAHLGGGNGISAPDNGGQFEAQL